MNNLLIFFAFPIAVIVFSYALQKLINNPVLVSAIIFSVFLIITFAAFDETFLIATLAYTILSFIVATLTQISCKRNQQTKNNEAAVAENISENNNINNNICCSRYRRF